MSNKGDFADVWPCFNNFKDLTHTKSVVVVRELATMSEGKREENVMMLAC